MIKINTATLEADYSHQWQALNMPLLLFQLVLTLPGLNVSNSGGGPVGVNAKSWALLGLCNFVVTHL
jgi:hypothetical protein